MLRSKAVLPANLPFPDGVRIDNFVILSGQIGVTPGTLTLVPGGIEARNAADLRESAPDARRRMA